MFDERTFDTAYERYVDNLRSVVACVANQRFQVAPYAQPARRSFLLRFARPVPMRALDGGSSGFRFDMQIRFSVERIDTASNDSWQVETRMYEYRFLDRDERELLVYHWQPGPEYAGPDAPHLHVSASLDAQVDARTRREVELDKLHIVTGIVSLQAVVRMLITEFQIRPLRDDWQERLDATPTH